MTLMLALMGCGPVPASLDYVNEMSVYDGDLISPEIQVYDREGQRIEGASVLIARSARAEVVRISSDGFYCLKTGESELTLTSGKLEHPLLVKCRLVDKVLVEPATIRATLERDPERGWLPQTLPAPKVQILDAEGVSMPELLQEPVSSKPEVLAINPDGSLQALALGRSVLTYAAGGESAEVVVDLGRLVDANIRLKVPPGGRQVVPLKPGLQVADLSANLPIDARMDSPSCVDSMSGRQILGLECEIGDRGSLVVENPSRSTARVKVKLTVYEASGS